MTQMNLFLDGSHAGVVEQGPGGSLRLTYSQRHLVSRGPTPLSLSMPLAGVESITLVYDDTCERVLQM